MADLQLQWLKDRFRSAVDDLDIDPADQSGLLWSDDDVLEYIDAAHAQFIHGALYKHDVLELVVVADDPRVRLPTRAIELRGTTAYLKTAGVLISETNLEGRVGFKDDYGVGVSASPFSDEPPGTPRAFSADFESDELYLFPASSIDDTLQVAAYVEGREIDNWDCSLDIKNSRHVRMLLNGMKALAYDKQDADTLDPQQAERWRQLFERDIQSVISDRKRRARRPETVRYGGL